MTVEAGPLNNVDLAAVGALVSAIQEDPAKADTTWAAHVTWAGGFQSSARVRGFDYAANAAVAGIQLDALTVDLKGDLDLRGFLGLAEGHAGFDTITAKVQITSPAPRADLEALHAKVTASSPVGHTLAAAVPVTVNLV